MVSTLMRTKLALEGTGVKKEYCGKVKSKRLRFTKIFSYTPTVPHLLDLVKEAIPLLAQHLAGGQDQVAVLHGRQACGLRRRADVVGLVEGGYSREHVRLTNSSTLPPTCLMAIIILIRVA